MAKRTHSIEQRRPAKKQNRRWIYIGLISLAAVAVVALLIFLNQPSAPTTASPTVAFAGVPNPNGTSMGNPNAKVLVEEYSDFQCPYCKLFYTDIEPTLVNKYVATNLVRFVYSPFSFIGTESKLSAEASFCAADQNKFWEMHAQIFAAQGAENVGTYTKTSLNKMATQAGLDIAAYKSCMDKGTNKQKVEDFNTQAMSRKVTSTPSFFVNGVGPLSSNEVLAEVEKALTGQ
jgi:protein-disulfide isomerase